MLAQAEVALSCVDLNFETTRSWQAHFLKFCQTHKVEPELWLGFGSAWVSFISLYAKSIVMKNTIDRGKVRAQMV